MADYTQKLLDDLVEQFKGQTNITALMETVGEQLTAVSQFYEDLQYKRNIAASEGKQLDGIGDIVCLTRVEASALASMKYDGTMTDELYRMFLYYKIFANTANCTYADIMRSIYMFWPGELSYAEEVDKPASIVLEFLRYAGYDIDALFQVPILKPAGVRLWFRGRTDAACNIYAGIGCLESKSATYRLTTTKRFLPSVLADEDSVLLCDENGNILCEEGWVDEDGTYYNATDEEVLAWRT